MTQCVGSVKGTAAFPAASGGVIPTPTLQFDAAWRRRTTVSACSVAKVAHHLKAHYLHRRPGVVVLCLWMTCGPVDAGAIVFALPPRETHKRYGGLTWELARLYLIDSIPNNAETWFIGFAIRYIRQRYTHVRYLVSYADPSVGHTGTIYRAANWLSDGRTDDERKSPRCDYLGSNGKRYSRRGHVPDDVTVKRVPRVSKFRFVYHLGDR